MNEGKVLSMVPATGDWFVSWYLKDADGKTARRDGYAASCMARVAAWAHIDTGETVPLIAADQGGLIQAQAAIGSWDYHVYEARQAYRYYIERHDGTDWLEGPGSGDAEAVAFATDEHGHWVLWRTVASEAER